MGTEDGVDAASAGLAADAALWSAIEAELHAMARAAVARERPGNSLSAADLVNEVYLRLGAAPTGRELTRVELLRLATYAIEHVLVERGRRRRRRHALGGPVGRQSGSLLDVADPAPTQAGPWDHHDILSLHEAMDRLRRVDPDAAEIARLRHLGGLTEKEAAEAMGIGLRAASALWGFARAWLHRELRDLSRGS